MPENETYCPGCNDLVDGTGAVSRYDDTTVVCTQCGMREALIEANGGSLNGPGLSFDTGGNVPDRKVRAIIIPADDSQPVLVRRIDSGYRNIQSLVGGYVEGLALPANGYAYLNEDGKRLGLPINYRANAALTGPVEPWNTDVTTALADGRDLLVGPVVIVGADAAGDTASVPAEVLKAVRTALDKGYGGVREPRVAYWDGDGALVEDGEYIVAEVVEGVPGFQVESRHPSLDAARDHAHLRNGAQGHTPEQVMEIVESSMKATGSTNEPQA